MLFLYDLSLFKQESVTIFNVKVFQKNIFKE